MMIYVSTLTLIESERYSEISENVELVDERQLVLHEESSLSGAHWIMTNPLKTKQRLDTKGLGINFVERNIISSLKKTLWTKTYCLKIKMDQNSKFGN